MPTTTPKNRVELPPENGSEPTKEGAPRRLDLLKIATQSPAESVAELLKHLTEKVTSIAKLEAPKGDSEAERMNVAREAVGKRRNLAQEVQGTLAA